MAFQSQRDYGTLNQICDEFDICERKLYQLRDAGKLTFYKLGRKNYVKRSDLESLLVQDLPKLPTQKLTKSFV